MANKKLLARASSEAREKAASILLEDWLDKWLPRQFWGLAERMYCFSSLGKVQLLETIDPDSGFCYQSTIETQFQNHFDDDSILSTIIEDQLEELARCQIIEAPELIPSPELAT